MSDGHTLKERLEARLRAMEKVGLARGTDARHAEEACADAACGQGRSGAPVSFQENDYLGLARDPFWRSEVARCFSKASPSGRSSRLVGGHTQVHHKAERALAGYFGADEAVCFPSGYQGNLALVAGLVQKGQDVFVDRRIHASVAFALRSSGAVVHAFSHNDPADLDRRLSAAKGGLQPVVFTESLFSMDGSLADPGVFAELKKAHGFVLVVDEAHALGCLGPGGRGVFHRGPADVRLGTFGKALGLFGAFALLPSGWTRYLENFSSPLMHSTALPEAHAFSVLRLVDLLPGLEDRRRRLAANAAFLKTALTKAGLPPAGDAHVLSVPVGDAGRALALADRCSERGFAVFAARSPTVPEGRAALRLSLSADHTEEDCLALTEVLKAAFEELGA